MKLNALSSLEEMLERVEMLSIPSSKEGMAAVYREILVRVLPASTLPLLSDLTIGKSGTHFFYGHWGDRHIKVQVSYEGEKMTESCAYNLSKKMAIKARSENAQSIGFVTHLLGDASRIQSAIAGWTAGQYDLGLFKKSDEQNGKTFQNTLVTVLPKNMDVKVAHDGISIGLVQQEVMTLVNMPASHKSPEFLGLWAQRSADKYDYECEVLDKKKLANLGMDAILAVNRGSQQPAHLIITRYQHPDASKRIALIGKGVIFDTGGLSIKDSKNMHYMKSDMAGAAAALGTVEACARLGLKVDVTAIAPATDNSVDAASTKPGDVISSYAGKTIEVIDTDAEGRLILADALAYAIKEFKPDVMIDMATLTGSIVAALGPQAAGLFTKNDQLALALSAAGDASGERVWRMPMYEEYGEEMSSDIADIKNLSEKPYAGAITAAKFLEVFTSDHPAWAHLD
ncbi:MAG TPA: leucyl aminopeptidase family protein, partial [Saprospiraceae bacterium]|nr:leucyl aminopeptidase family protein [Saprospiraceae bacterium]